MEQANDFHTHSGLTFSAYELARNRNLNKRVGVEKARGEMKREYRVLASWDRTCSTSPFWCASGEDAVWQKPKMAQADVEVRVKCALSDVPAS